MKSLLLASLALFSATVFASPKVGDSATYLTSIQGYSINHTQTIVAYDAARDVYTVRETDSEGTSTDTENKSEDMVSSESATMLIAYCETEMVKGVLETVTVPAGTFQTCRMTNDDGAIVNVGVVPFGVVKVQIQGAVVELQSYVAL